MSSTDTILLLGGTGKVGSRIAPLLKAANVPALIASRSGKSLAGLPGIKFDWENESTWEATFANSATPIKAVFLVSPLSSHPETIMNKFVDFAVAKGAKRFVLLGASSIEEGGPWMGLTHKYLREQGDQGKLEWAVLRPTWFQQNFSEGGHVFALKSESKLYSASGSGKIPFINAEDIAAVGFHALTSPQPPNTDYIILGSELLSYSDLAAIFSAVLNRPVEYVELSEAELAARWSPFMEPEYARTLAAMDTDIKNGAENRTNDVVRTVTGKEPRKFRDFVEENKAVWL
ncbi:putative ergot alkaloid A [Annulohypoxylon maeteangense]|uniref:putative ergot alkaloid A n=1 Tax=Annulohypoxylon maeteangense TaxID=1927788 RepID=UPI0020077A67|nr:putative ergot alkaloid A [Annulohypoxylon maeteangense]KAI0881521.1 putative ergot alkaloid A [Annulohypoxylon maeteangense]